MLPVTKKLIPQGNDTKDTSLAIEMYIELIQK